VKTEDLKIGALYHLINPTRKDLLFLYVGAVEHTWEELGAPSHRTKNFTVTRYVFVGPAGKKLYVMKENLAYYKACERATS
jgi:hypothetical protein